MDYTLALAIILLFLAAWYGWRYYKLRRDIDEYASHARAQSTFTNIKELENLASALSSLITNFNSQHAALDAERARLANVLEQMTDGVLIADSQGIVQFANPAA
ncbi:MAG TPA: hypothetical protein VFR47_19810, partial [Anaerolineales bacterium]|nr:hypothetical protein [Anaerolineales bacterium]